MSRITKKRALITAAITSLVLVAVAVAFYTTAGDGTGSGTADTAYAANLDILGSVTTADEGTLVPGGDVDIEGTIENTNEGAAKVSNLSGTVDPVPAGCLAAWFEITDVDIDDTVAPDDVVEAGETVDFTATLEMEDAHDTTTGAAIDQDDCKGATLDIAWQSDAS